jgi:hypothetical protein
MFRSFSPKEFPLTPYEYPISEVNGMEEEGLFNHLRSIIPDETRFCIEFGAGNGQDFLAVRDLIERHGYSALLIEGDPNEAKELRRNYEGNERVHCVESFITRKNIEDLFRQNSVPDSPDFLLIDIDGNDYYIWEALVSYKPKIVCIEYNASYAPPEDFVVEYDPGLNWQGDDYYSASITMLVKLGKQKGYELIHCKTIGDNLIFVQADLFHLFNIPDNSPQAMYQMPWMGIYGRADNGKGHPASRRTTGAMNRLWYFIRYYLLTFSRMEGRRKVREIQKQNKTLKKGLV